MRRIQDHSISKNSLHKKLQEYIRTAQFFDDSTEDYIYIYDLTAGRVFLTDKFREKYPIPPAQEDGNSICDWNGIVYPKDRELMTHYRNMLIRGETDSFNIACRIYDREGKRVWVRVKGQRREREDTQSMLIVGRISEISAGGMIDQLTGLCGIDKLMEDVRQHKKTSDGYLMLLDLDNFKSLNISRGWEFCDSVLKRVADILDACAKYPMEMYRMEGDCFAVNFIEKRKEDIEAFYLSVKAAIEEICTISAGVVQYHRGEDTQCGELYLYAESALDKAKKSGKDRIIFFSADDYQKNLEQVELLQEMKASVRDQCSGFYLEYQPQVSGRDFSVYGVEALLRYRSKTRGVISPDEFIPLLEQTELICMVGKWVMHNAIYQCKKWREQLPELRVSVNISYVQLQRACITDMVLGLLKEAELPGEALTLELTESVQLQNYRHFNKIFYIWKRNGIHISIDDFGTGYSSLGYLKSIEINEVKIDKCFVKRVHCNAYNFRLLNNMIELAHSAGIQVCCEGVETLEELLAVQELHADILQGFFFSKPCAPEAFEERYLNRSSEIFCERMEKLKKLRLMKPDESRDIWKDLRNEEIGSITESMDEVVYVSDPETYELYYLNATGRRMTGIYDYKGCKCYEVLQGRSAPCEFCTNDRLNKENFLIWEKKNPYLGRHFILKDKLILWKGKLARVEIAFDITDKEILSQSIQTRLRFEQAIVDSCKILVSGADTEDTVYQVLQIMRDFCHGESAYILKAREGGRWTCLWEQCGSARPLHQRVTDTVDALCGQGRIVYPIVCQGKTVGYVGLDNPADPENSRELIKTLAYFFGYTAVGDTLRKEKDA